MSKELNKAPVEQAGGDERDFQAEGAQEVPSPVSQEYDRHLISLLRKGEALPGHQEEAADEIERLRDWNDHLNNTVLPNILNPNFLMLMKGGERLLDLCTKDGKFIGVSLNDMKDVFDWMVTHARIAPDHAALAQPSPASDLDPLNLAPHAEAFNEAPAEALKPEQAEAERPEMSSERAAYFMRRFKSEEKLLGPNEQAAVDYVLSLIAQHERIVGVLRAEIAEWQEAAGRSRSDVVAYIAERAKLLEERDAALVEVERLRESKGDPVGSLEKCMKVMYERDEHAKRLEVAQARIAELERQEPVSTEHLPMHIAYARAKREVFLGSCQEDVFRFALIDLLQEFPLYAGPVAQAQQLNDLDKQCRDDVARALGLRPNQERGFAWSYLLASIKSCVKASGDSAQAQHSVPEASEQEKEQGWTLDYRFVERVTELAASRTEYTTSMEATEQVLLAARELLAAAPVCRLSRSALTDAQMRRLYDSSTETENERLGFAAFARLIRRAEAVHQIAAAPGKEVGHE
ncbi:hypothetical protein [Pseudomonas aeruginosa]|uniref:hypothetical protein n=1 Tax=Pseudomonas aeruginosa TaxID=287 RepID=UPI0007A916F0|nr:hypothetical protein [Pseudomonas aeruginosa]KYO83616.1 hypothetical protein LT19_05513 [Pseudomonas aeruginosa]MDQ9100390.1 hypothetical protein [Pseudomonas aeruginosa]HBN7998125.1 hypothetical protein [Pseudomonas aeruginosa]HBN8821378.1 hypothetical protein [Pseudomonas aeruginosa]HCF2451663.1 hypothetical protein [Pseudomonas aeruginosa]